MKRLLTSYLKLASQQVAMSIYNLFTNNHKSLSGHGNLDSLAKGPQIDHKQVYLEPGSVCEGRLRRISLNYLTLGNHKCVIQRRGSE